MRQRLESLIHLGGKTRKLAKSIPFAAGVKRALAAGYNFAAFRADLMAGIVVAMVALPLSMALAIAVKVPPQHGLYTAIVAGIVVSLTGGSKFQITGPTAAFIVILAPIVTKYGLSGLLTAGLMAGIILIIMGIARLGKLIQYIPHPVTTGFTTGIAVVIATLQLKDALGLTTAEMPDHYLDKLTAMWDARTTFAPWELVVAASTLGLLIVIPKVSRVVPAPLIAMGLVATTVAVIHHFEPSFEVATIGTRFHSKVNGVMVDGIPPLPPTPMLPWGDAELSFGYFRELLPSAFAIAMLGAIESLLSAVVADGMTGKRHDPNAELIGLGLGNIVTPFFGGIAATGALARTATNVRAGARSPFSAVIHSIVILLSILFIAKWVSYIPMASLAGLLLLVAWNMSEARHFKHILQVAPKSDVFVLLTCFFLTVVFDMVIAVAVGIVLAALLFMRRMAELTQARVVLDDTSAESSIDLEKGIAVYEIAGPLFFGAAQSAMNALGAIHGDVRHLILDLGRVPTIDATGLVALESVIERLRRGKKHVIIAGPLPEPRNIFTKSDLTRWCTIVGSREEALNLARERLHAPQSEPSTRLPVGK